MKRTLALLAMIAIAGPSTFAVADDEAKGSIEFVAGNMFQTAHGSFQRWKIAASRVDPEDVAGSFVEIEVDVASLETGIEGRDEHLRTADFFEVETYPTALIRVHGAEKLAGTAEGKGRYRAKFDIDLHGVERTLPGEFMLLEGTPAVVEGDLLMNRLDFEVGAPRRFWNPLSITEEISVSFRAELPLP